MRRVQMSRQVHIVTAEELERRPRDDWRYELVEGRLVRMSPAALQHGRIVARFLARLSRHVEAHRLGEAVTEVGFRLASNPDTVRAPDVAFIRRARIPAADARGFFQGPPDLAVEVLSPDDWPSETRQKIAEYLACGVTCVLIIAPDVRTATTHRRPTSSLTASGDETIDLDDVVPGFRCTVREIVERV
jgi:Uma2 family endonuclease